MNNKYGCVKEIKNADHPCLEKECRHFFKCEQYKNCSIVAAENGPMTLQEIGNNFNLSRMRICQIEKNLLNKIKNDNKKLNDF